MSRRKSPAILMPHLVLTEVERTQMLLPMVRCSPQAGPMPSGQSSKKGHSLTAPSLRSQAKAYSQQSAPCETTDNRLVPIATCGDTTVCTVMKAAPEKTRAMLGAAHWLL